MSSPVEKVFIAQVLHISSSELIIRIGDAGILRKRSMFGIGRNSSDLFGDRPSVKLELVAQGEVMTMQPRWFNGVCSLC
jgi:hypothetical protein